MAPLAKIEYLERLTTPPLCACHASKICATHGVIAVKAYLLVELVWCGLDVLPAWQKSYAAWSGDRNGQLHSPLPKERKILPFYSPARRAPLCLGSRVSLSIGSNVRRFGLTRCLTDLATARERTDVERSHDQR